jgi:hypothetical protein
MKDNSGRGLLMALLSVNIGVILPGNYYINYHFSAKTNKGRLKYH